MRTYLQRLGRLLICNATMFLCIHTIYAIPRLLKLPVMFDEIDSKLVYQGSAPLLNSDEICREYYEAWWPIYQRLREEAQTEYPEDPLLTAEFTRYSQAHIDLSQLTHLNLIYADVPVESFRGERFRPLDRIDYKHKKWGCYTACQDVRKTVEWILTARLTKTIQLRARVTFAFLCLDDEMAELYTDFTRRERETLEEQQAAIQAFKESYLPGWEYIQKLNQLEMYGDRGPEIRKCRCIKALVPVREVESEMLGKRKGQRGKFVHQTLYGSKRSRRRNIPIWDGASPRPSFTSSDGPAEGTHATNIPDEVDDIDLAMSWLNDLPIEAEDHEETLISSDPSKAEDLNDITCYDFDFPDIDTGRTLEDVDGADVYGSPRSPNVLHAALFADFDTWVESASNVASSSNLGPKHDRK